MIAYRCQNTLLGGLGILWAIWLIVFDSYNVSPVLSVLREWNVTEAVIIIWPGTAGTGLLFLPYPWKRQLHFVMSAFWFFITLAVAENNITLTAVPVYATIGLLHACSGMFGAASK